MKRFFVFTLVLLLVAGVFAACSPQPSPANPATPADSGNGYKPGDKFLVGLSIRGLDNPYYIELVEGVKQFVDNTPGAEMVIMEHAGDDQKEINDVKAFATRGLPSILYIDPQSQAVCAPVAEICEEAGIYWFSAYTLGKGVYPWTMRPYFVAHQALDDVTAGYEVAKCMFEQFEGKDATILCMAGELSNLASINRIRGLEQALAEYPNVKLLDTQPADWLTQKALDVAQTWLVKYSDVDGIWVANDSMAVGVVEALKAKQLNGKVKVTGVDCIPGGIESVQNGDMTATFYPYPKLMGGYGVAIAYAALSGKIDPSTLSKEQSCFLTPGLLVTTDNAKQIQSDVIDKAAEIDLDNPMSWATKVGPLVIDEETGN